MSTSAKTKQLLIQGDISDETLNLLQTFSSTPISALVTKSVTSEALNLIFNDFNAIAFTRDLIIGSFISAAYDEIKGSINFLLERKKEIEKVTFTHVISLNGKAITINTISSPSQVVDIIRNVDNQFKQLEELDLEFIDEITITIDGNKTVRINSL